MKYISLILLFLFAYSGFSQDTIKVDSLNKIIRSNEKLITQGLLSNALDSCFKMENLFSQMHSMDSLILARIYMQKANIYYLQYEYQNSEIAYQNSKSILERNNFKTYNNYLKCLDQLALVYRKSGKFNLSKTEYENLLNIKYNLRQIEDSSYAVTLGDLSLLYLDYAYYDKAKEMLERTLSLHKKIFGPDHLLLANVYNNLGLYYQKINEFEKSENCLLEALRIRQAKVGIKYSAFITTQLNLSKIYLADGKFFQADSLIELVLKSREETVGKNHSFYATALLHQAAIKKEKGELKLATAITTKAILLMDSLYSKKHKFYIQSQINLAAIQKDLGNYKNCIEKLNQCDKLLTNDNSDNILEFAKVHFELAKMFHQVGFLEKSDEYYSLCKGVYETIYGKSSTYYADLLKNYGKLYNDLGNYTAMKESFQNADSIWIQSKLESSSDYADLLQDWSNIELDHNKFKSAEELINKALNIYSTSYGLHHSKTALCMSSLANILAIDKKYISAEKQYQSSLSILNEVYIPSHLNILKTQLDYSNLLFKIDSIDKSMQYINSGMNVIDSSYSSTHILKANYLILYARILEKQNKKNQSDSCFKLALEILKLSDDKGFSNYLTGLREYIQFNENRNNYKLTEDLLNELASIHMEKLNQAVLYLTSFELSKYAEKYYNDILLFSQIIQNRFWKGTALGQLPAIGYDFLLFYKGFLLHSAAQLNYAVNQFQENDSLLLELKICHHSLLKEYEHEPIRKSEINLLEKRLNKIQKTFIKKLKNDWANSKQVRWKDIQNKLNNHEAAIEFVSNKLNDRSQSSKIIYAALVIKPNYKVPKFILLFEESSLDSLLNINVERKADYVNSLYGISQRGASEIGTVKPSLSQLIYEPLKTELADVKTVYYAPSGLLHRVNLDAIPINSINSEQPNCSETITLADLYHIVRLNNTRQLVFSKPKTSTVTQANLYGAIDYNLSATYLKNNEVQDSTISNNQMINEIQNMTKTWSALPNTEKEINSIKQILNNANISSEIYLGKDATEESFKLSSTKKNTSPYIFHFGTHGYFFSEIENSTNQNDDQEYSTLSEKNLNRTSAPSIKSKESVFKTSDQPMLRSGLILAGGNLGWMMNSEFKEIEDGVLTAYEISQMNLSSTELVVLAACETGLGDIQGNEGVYGLQRAFKIAGVRYIIMSLWQVPDKQTNQLMITFYKKWLENKMSIPDALHAAQKELRDIGFDPYYWAGFVLVE